MQKVLVTGVGGGAGQSVLKALQDQPFDTVGVDSEELAAGLHAVAKAYKGHYASDERFINRLLEICRIENCDLIIPGHDVELPKLASNVDRLTAAGVTPVVSTPEVIQLCDDKLQTQAFLQQQGFPVIHTTSLADFTSFKNPVVLKPQRGGARSRATYVARTQREFDNYRELVDPDNCVVQEYIEGDEYTCGSVSFDGKCLGAIAMKRVLRNGDTYKAFVEHPSSLDSFVAELAESLNPFGPLNVQLRVRDGKPYVFELNARCSGTTGARSLAGFNEPRMIVDYLRHNVVSTYQIREISILRYWQELVVENGRFEALRESGVLDGDGTKL